MITKLSPTAGLHSTTVPPELVGIVVGCYADKRMTEEGGAIELALDAYSEKYGICHLPERACWVYYMITSPSAKRGLKSYGLDIFDIVRRHVIENGVETIVADYMIATEDNPHTCEAGKHLMEVLGFRETGAVYDNCDDPEYIEAQKAESPLPIQEFALMVCDLTATPDIPHFF